MFGALSVLTEKYISKYKWVERLRFNYFSMIKNISLKVIRASPREGYF